MFTWAEDFHLRKLQEKLQNQIKHEGRVCTDAVFVNDHNIRPILTYKHGSMYSSFFQVWLTRGADSIHNKHLKTVLLDVLDMAKSELTNPN